jgi:RNA polymerase sigma-70 factor (ECF subfamily)
MGERDREAELDAVLAQGRSAWPALRALEREHVRAYIDARVPADVPWATLPAADLYFACACALGDPAALQAFEDRYAREVAIAAAKLRAPDGVLDEARQVVRDLLFVGKPGGAPAIASYAGRGDLRGWVRVIAMREVLRLCDHDRREVTTGDDELLEALSPASDPELDQLKAKFRGEFAEAFRESVLALSARERTLLRHHVIDGLGVEAIGGLYKVHHSTAARWLVKAREALLEGTRTRLASKLRMSRDEVDSVLRMIRSRIEVSIEKLLEK